MSVINNHSNIYSSMSADNILRRNNTPNINTNNINTNNINSYPPISELMIQMENMMRRVIKEELKPINQKLEKMDKKIDILIENQKNQDKDIQKICDALQ